MSSSPNERYGIDCINMVSFASANGGIDRGWKFILTVVDYFSRKCWLRPLKSQTAINVRNTVINIVAETKTYPILESLNAIMGQNSKPKHLLGLKSII